MRLFPLPFALCLCFSSLAFPQSDPTNQAANSWVFQYRKAELGDVTHPYECGFVWDYKNDIGVVFGGHLGTFYGQLEDDLVEIQNTNMTYYFSFTDSKFHKAFPSARPPKRCGVKTAFDGGWGATIEMCGGFHNYDNGYYEPNIRLTGLVQEQSAEDPFTLSAWAFDGKSKQWYDMRPLRSDGPPNSGNYNGYGSNLCFATEYGLTLMSPTRYDRVYAYSPYSNEWTLLPVNAADPEKPPIAGNICTVYDNKHRKMIFIYGNTSNVNDTWAYDVGTHSWTKLTLNAQPSKSTTSWYDWYGSASYDSKNGVAIYLKSDGTETWALDLDNSTWTSMAPTGAPSSAGNMGEGMAFDPKRNASLVFANKNDEVWTYKYGPGITNRPDAPSDPSGVTSANGIALTWKAPASGAAPVKYYVYRAEWEDNKGAATGIIPGPYVKLDSTTAAAYADNQADTLKKAGVFHSYCITAVSAQGIESDRSSPVFTRLRVPLGLAADVYSKTRVDLRWKPKSESDFAGYNVYRAQKAYPRHNVIKATKLNGALITGASRFTDNAVSLSRDTLAMYVVTAVNALGKESGLSPYALTLPDGVVNMWVDTANKTVTWSPPRNGKLTGYRIYEGRQGTWTGGSGNPVATATVTDTFWSYASKVTIFAYKVRAINALGTEGYFSDVMAVQSKDDDKFGTLRLDFSGDVNHPVPDAFFSDIPPVGVERAGSGGFSGALTAFPNPFNRSVSFAWDPHLIIRNAKVSIYDAQGKRVVSLTPAPAGKAEWHTGPVPVGVYFARLTAGEKVMEKRLVLIR